MHTRKRTCKIYYISRNFNRIEPKLNTNICIVEMIVIRSGFHYEDIYLVCVYVEMCSVYTFIFVTVHI